MAIKQCLIRIFEYNTPLVLHTNSKTIGITFRCLQLVVGLFIFIYYIGYKGGYQTVSHTIISSTNLERKDEMKSLAHTPGMPSWLVVKSGEKLHFATSLRLTFEVKGHCPEVLFLGWFAIAFPVTEGQIDPRVQFSRCDPLRNRCIRRGVFYGGNGEMTGKCVEYQNYSIHTCEISGDCPFNSTFIVKYGFDRYKPVAVIAENYAFFPEFPASGYLKNFEESTMTCWRKGYYHSPTHPSCPVFTFERIVEEAAKNYHAKPFTFDDVIRTGGVFLMRIMWDCNFDVEDTGKQCSIDYEFQRLDSNVDVMWKSPDFKRVVPGFIADTYAFRLLVLTEGRARKFDFVALLTRLGTSVGLFAFVALCCEIMLVCACCANEQKIRGIKFVEIEKELMEGRSDVVVQL